MLILIIFLIVTSFIAAAIFKDAGIGFWIGLGATWIFFMVCHVVPPNIETKELTIITYKCSPEIGKCYVVFKEKEESFVFTDYNIVCCLNDSTKFVEVIERAPILNTISTSSIQLKNKL